MAEWSIAPVLKTGKGQPFVSSNLTASARKMNATQIKSHEGAQCLRVVHRIFHCFIGLAVPRLYEVHAQHALQTDGTWISRRLGVHRPGRADRCPGAIALRPATAAWMNQTIAFRGVQSTD